MSDLSDPNMQTSDPSAMPAQEQVITPQVDSNSMTEIPADTGMPDYEEAPPTVVVSNNSNSVPKWFYFLFSITILVFMAVTVMLILRYTNNKLFLSLFGSGRVEPTILPTAVIMPSPTASYVVAPSSNPSPTATSSVNLKLGQLTAGDEITDLQKDVNNTDFSQWGKVILEFNQQIINSGLKP